MHYWPNGEPAGFTTEENKHYTIYGEQLTEEYDIIVNDGCCNDAKDNKGIVGLPAPDECSFCGTKFQ